MMGRRMALEDAPSVAEKDRVFYRQSDGGVTFSRGDALLKPRFLKALVERYWEAGLPMALETCGHYSWGVGKSILAKMDLVFLAVKHMDSVVHRQLT
jgi:pyruvate formate lyase activating enzyme